MVVFNTFINGMLDKFSVFIDTLAETGFGTVSSFFWYLIGLYIGLSLYINVLGNKERNGR